MHQFIGSANSIMNLGVPADCNEQCVPHHSRHPEAGMRTGSGVVRWEMIVSGRDDATVLNLLVVDGEALGRLPTQGHIARDECGIAQSAPMPWSGRCAQGSGLGEMGPPLLSHAERSGPA